MKKKIGMAAFNQLKTTVEDQLRSYTYVSKNRGCQYYFHINLCKPLNVADRKVILQNIIINFLNIFHICLVSWNLTDNNWRYFPLKICRPLSKFRKNWLLMSYEWACCGIVPYLHWGQWWKYLHKPCKVWDFSFIFNAFLLYGWANGKIFSTFLPWHHRYPQKQFTL